MVASLNPFVRTIADASPPDSHAQHSVSVVDLVSVKNKLIVTACKELVGNGSVH